MSLAIIFIFFDIFQVNGKDLSKATHEEAVEAFKNAQEPIIVQVMRRSPCTAKNGSTTPNGQGAVPGPVERTMCSVGTQTELQSEDLLWKVLQRCSLPPTDKNCDDPLDGLCELDAEDPLSVLDSELLQKLEAMEGNLDLPILDEEDCLDRAYEMEYEDIVLKRTNLEEKLGLTLCYGSEEDSGIFISEVRSETVLDSFPHR
nr:PDZ domain-containing RING finger protein 4-like [Lytechinus pictus]